MTKKSTTSTVTPGVVDAKRTLHFGKMQTLEEQQHYKSNFIKTSKYTLITYLPKAVLIQFNRYANFFFLLAAIVQSIPKVSPLNPISSIAPFVFVIALSVIREGYEDYLRHKSDKELNRSPCEIFRNGQFASFQWKDIRVGEIIRVKDGEFIASDFILLSTSNEHSVAYIETSSLDGEKNLKTKASFKDLIELTSNGLPSDACEGTIVCDSPNPLLYRFEGYLELKNAIKLMVGIKNFLYRGSKLKNTDWAVGIVVYTGEDTKVMRNAEISQIKQSHIEKMINKGILGLLLIMLVFCLLCATGNFIWNALNLDSSTVHHINYLSKQYSIGVEAIIDFFAYFLLLNTMIPISLIVTLEFVKLFQSFFINKDADMYNPENDRYARVSATTIIEELGQVEYVFSDKTGTLTCNKMEFKLCMIGNKLYGDKSFLKNQPAVTTPNLRKASSSVRDLDESVDYNFDNRELNADLRGQADVETSVEFYGSKNAPIISHKVLMHEFMQCISLCHDCVVQKNSNGDYSFHGPSPDEVTLVDFAKRNGYFFTGTQQGSRLLEIDGTEQKFELLQLFEFDSDRKRMSVIVRDSSGLIRLYSKGADMVIKKLLSKDVPQTFLAKTDAYVDAFSLKGLRTLLVAMRFISESEYAEIESKITSVIDTANREEKIKELAEQIEVNLTLIGCTGVEDKLQDQVPETIRDLLRANIKVWMLTGDKLETAENIGRSCNLILPSFEAFRIVEKTHEEVEQKLKEVKSKVDELIEKQGPKALLVEGEALAVIFDNDNLKKEFFEISKECESVICCRVNPKQKADVVRLIKNNLHKITLALGDGANDVNMIQAAHIGVGLYGQEGMRAVQASDFAIPEFKALWRLLFVHGRWCYIRVAEMVLYFFYKNMVFTLPALYYAFICAFSGQTLFDSWYMSLFNTIFTLLPVVVKACFDQDVYFKKKVYETAAGTKIARITELTNVKKSYPLLYSTSLQLKIFNYRSFVASVAKGALHGVGLFLLTYFSLDRAIIGSDGTNSDFWYFSITVFTSVIFVVDLKLAIYTKYWTLLMWAALLVTSLGFYIAYVWFGDTLDSYPIARTAQVLFTTPHFYLIVLMNTSIVFLLEAMYIYIKKEHYTEAADFIISLVKSKREQDQTKFERIEEDILDSRRKKTMHVHAQSMDLEKKNSKGSRNRIKTVDMASSERLSGKGIILDPGNRASTLPGRETVMQLENSVDQNIQTIKEELPAQKSVTKIELTPMDQGEKNVNDIPPNQNQHSHRSSVPSNFHQESTLENQKTATIRETIIQIRSNNSSIQN